MQELLSFLERNHEIMSIVMTAFLSIALTLSIYVARRQSLELRMAEKKYVELLKKESEFIKLTQELQESEIDEIRKELASKYFGQSTFDEKVFTKVFFELDDSEKNLLQSAVFQKADKNRKAYFEHLVDIAKKRCHNT